ncbi:hypothetical protein NUW58_g8917 [Xylaria curta]|uniref:Uncharacterized protein n=1 Tax=Xylaria curta TaxID=42375 RepID=A0ACC1N3M8_9PEZI|nr:hypothetical protein NUW58_g8917 [Xylaria curta]
MAANSSAVLRRALLYGTPTQRSNRLPQHSHFLNNEPEPADAQQRMLVPASSPRIANEVPWPNERQRGLRPRRLSDADRETASENRAPRAPDEPLIAPVHDPRARRPHQRRLDALCARRPDRAGGAAAARRDRDTQGEQRKRLDLRNRCAPTPSAGTALLHHLLVLVLVSGEPDKTNSPDRVRARDNGPVLHLRCVAIPLRP